MTEDREASEQQSRTRDFRVQISDFRKQITGFRVKHGMTKEIAAHR
jgi:hypothetical protein